MTKQKLLTQLFVKRLQETGGNPNRGASEAELAAFEETHHLKLPTALRDLYKLANGSQDGSLADGYFWFWSLEKIKEDDGARRFEIENETWYEVVFGDFLIGSILYGIQFTESDKTKLVMWNRNPQESYQFGNTLEDFLRMYLDRSSKIEGMIF